MPTNAGPICANEGIRIAESERAAEAMHRPDGTDGAIPSTEAQLEPDGGSSDPVHAAGAFHAARVRQEHAAARRAASGSRQGPPSARECPALPSLQRASCGPASPPLCTSKGARPEGQRRVHRPPMPEASSRGSPQRRRGGLVARHRDRPHRDRTRAVGREPRPEFKNGRSSPPNCTKGSRCAVDS